MDFRLSGINAGVRKKSNLLFLMLGPVNKHEVEQSRFSLLSALLFPGVNAAGGSLLGMGLLGGSLSARWSQWHVWLIMLGDPGAFGSLTPAA